jgi:hypothetical protein
MTGQPLSPTPLPHRAKEKGRLAPPSFHAK